MLSKDYRFFLECGVKIKEQGVYQGVKKLLKHLLLHRDHYLKQNVF